MYRALVGVGALCGLLIVSVFELTGPTIERNRRRRSSARSSRCCPAPPESVHLRVLADGFAPVPGTGEGAPASRAVHAAYDAAGNLVGVALEASRHGLRRHDPACSTATRSSARDRRHESAGEPRDAGAGRPHRDRRGLPRQLRGARRALAGDGPSALANPIVTVKHGEKTEPWEIDGITGATISAQAVGAALDDSAAYWLPRVHCGRRGVPADGGGR
jgi:Na+-translocating ferredoxin:NAD+ oxidoreductase subunit G